MNTAQIIIFFEAKGNGWEEVYYCPSGSLSDAYSRGIELATVRQKLLANTATMSLIRTADAENPRNSQLTPLDMEGNPAYTSNADDVNVALMMRLYNLTDNRTRALYLRGNPDNAYDTAQPDNADAQIWKTAYAGLGQYLAGKASNGFAWSIKAKVRPDAGGGPGTEYPITSIGSDPTFKNQTRIISTVAAQVTPGSFVTLYKMNGVQRLGGLYRVLSIDPGGTFINIGFNLGAGSQYVGGGFAVVYTSAFVPIGDYAGKWRATRRVTGRAFDVSRGRRRSLRK